MQIHELPSGTPETEDMIPFDTGESNYKTPFSGFDVGENTATFTSADEADPSIFKTGTSNQFQNIIALGSTTSYTVAVWMGNFEGETVIGEGSVIGANAFITSSVPAGSRVSMKNQ